MSKKAYIKGFICVMYDYLYKKGPFRDPPPLKLAYKG